MANTTNLNLAKPGLDDDALITDINNNMDKIDTWAGTTDTDIADVRFLKSIGSFGTESDFVTALDAKLAAMENYTTAVFRIQVSTAFTPFGKTTYVCRLSKLNSNTYGSALFESLNTTVTTHLIKGAKNSTWQFDLILADKYEANFSNLRVNRTDSPEEYVMFGNGTAAGWSGNAGAIIFNNTTNRYCFRSKGTTNTSNYDQFLLPVPSNDTNNHTFDILTTKDYPFVRELGVSPGGTTAGDGTNKITFSSPEGNRHCLICFADQFVNIFCPSTSGSTVYSGTLPSGWTLTRDGLSFTLTRSATQAFRYSLLWM